MTLEDSHQALLLGLFKVADLLALELRIPTYQRPYKWQAKHVNQLLDDIFHHIQTGKKGPYRIGSVVLHRISNQHEHHFDIVDGQQRLITLTLLAHALKEKNLALLQTSFSSPTTKYNIKTNAKLIQTRLKQSSALMQAVKDSLHQQLEIVCITLNDPGEAFQFFDSQNARGKPLAPYDLLKAFHLREIPPGNKRQTELYVETWENSICPPVPNDPNRRSHPSLDTIMRDILYPLRRWLNNENGMAFEQHAIDTFKGFSLATPPHWPIAKRLYMLDVIFPNNPLSDLHLPESYRVEGFPFQIEHPIINGKRFFEYIQHYRRRYHYLFTDVDSPIAQSIISMTEYEGYKRTGDGYIRRLFFSTVFLYYDRFGINRLAEAIRIIFKWSYYLRFEYQRIVASRVDNHAREPDGLLYIINKAVSPDEILAFITPSIEKPSKDDRVRAKLYLIYSEEHHNEK